MTYVLAGRCPNPTPIAAIRKVSVIDTRDKTLSCSLCSLQPPPGCCPYIMKGHMPAPAQPPRLCRGIVTGDPHSKDFGQRKTSGRRATYGRW